MTTARLRRLLLPILRAVRDGKPTTFRMKSAAAQSLFLLGKPASKGKGLAKQRKQDAASARRAHAEETGAIYDAVRARAGGVCECGCGTAFGYTSGYFVPEMDHFYGRARGQSVETCWMLMREHHQLKTENRPSREAWDEMFKAHCAKYGYEFKPRLIKLSARESGPSANPLSPGPDPVRMEVK